MIQESKTQPSEQPTNKQQQAIDLATSLLGHLFARFKTKSPFKFLIFAGVMGFLFLLLWMTTPEQLTQAITGSADNPTLIARIGLLKIILTIIIGGLLTVSGVHTSHITKKTKNDEALSSWIKQLEHFKAVRTSYKEHAKSIDKLEVERYKSAFNENLRIVVDIVGEIGIENVDESLYKDSWGS